MTLFFQCVMYVKENLEAFQSGINSLQAVFANTKIQKVTWMIFRQMPLGSLACRFWNNPVFLIVSVITAQGSSSARLQIHTERGDAANRARDLSCSTLTQVCGIFRQVHCWFGI